jgi:hypothetical protein
MLQYRRIKKIITVSIFCVFLFTSIPVYATWTATINDQMNDTIVPTNEKTLLVPISVSLFGKNGIQKHDALLSAADAAELYTMFQGLKQEMTIHPFNEKTQRLAEEFLSRLQQNGAVPAGLSTNVLRSLLQPPFRSPVNHPAWISPFENKASEWMCTFFSTGTGAAFPVIVLPRLIPILLTPIPRVILRWSAKDGVTSCGGLRSGTGYIAYGQQKGVTLGFWGVGITFSFPPVMNTYGLIGYSLYAGVSADYIEHFPPNSPPAITETDPPDGQELVPTSLSE